MNIGKHHILTVDRLTEPGAFLTDGKTDVLLPNKFLPADIRKGGRIRVFVYRDSEDRLISTTQKPYATLNEFAYLKVKDDNSVGAFLDWGIDKDLLVPFREQQHALKRGMWTLVYVFLDEKTDRIAATAKVSKHFSSQHTLQKGEEVNLLIADTTDLGVNVVVENAHRGLIFQSDLFHDLMEGDRIRGYVKNVREDGKLDISLRKEGLENLEAGAKQILQELQDNEGFLELTDKSDPEDIKSYLQMSKKNFKKSVGILYKKQLILLEKHGIRLKNEHAKK